MNSTTTFTFLLPAYKARFFADSLRSIQSQTISNFLCIVSDDCSPEDLKSIFDTTVGTDSRFIYRRNPKNMGSISLVSHWNLLVGMCETEWMILASDDDLYEPDFLEQVNLSVEKYPQVNLVRARVTNIDKDGNVCREEPASPEYVDQIHFYEQFFCKTYYQCIANFVFRTRVLKSKGCFIEFPMAICSDDATTLMMSEKGVANIQGSAFSFRLSGINLSHYKNVTLNSVRNKIAASNQFCGWMKQSFKDLTASTDKELETLGRIKEGIKFYLFCCTTSYLNYLPFGEFILEYRFILKNRLFPNKKKAIIVFAKWWRNRLRQTIPT